MPFDVYRIRKDFPMLSKDSEEKRFVYLDSAATTQKPQVMIDAMKQFYEEEYATVHRAVYDHSVRATEKYQEVRRLIQQFINAQHEEEIIFTRGTTESLNIVAQCYGRKFLKAGDEVLITEMEHHSNIVPWQFLVQEKGIKLIIAPINDKGELILEELYSKITPRTKIVSLCHVSNVFGTINPIDSIIEKAHAMGAIVVIDGAQSISHMPIDVNHLAADFYAFSGHKLYGPTGIGVLYGKKHLLEIMDPYHGGGDMIQEVTFDKSTFQAPPLKFEAGTPPFVQVLGLGASIGYFQSIDSTLLLRHEQALLQKATSLFSSIPGLTIYGTALHKGPVLSFTLDNVHTLDLGTLMALKGIAIRTGSLCAQPALRRFGLQTLARISFGLYNTPEEIDYTFSALHDSLALLS